MSHEQVSAPNLADQQHHLPEVLGEWYNFDSKAFSSGDRQIEHWLARQEETSQVIPLPPKA